MAEEMLGNGGIDAGAATAPQLFVNFQYIKDLSFENPRAPQSLTQPAAQPEVAINVNVQAGNLGPELFEVVLNINVTARAGDEPVFIVELAYGAMVTVKNASPAILPAMVLVEAPRIIFPFARAIIANATRDGGFPPLMINPIDFAELLRRQQPAAPAPEGAGGIAV